MRKPRAVLLVLALFAVLAVAACGDSSLTLVNNSSYTIIDVRLAPVGSDSWGGDLLGGTLLPGESLTINFIDCGHYDVQITDDTNATCVLSDLSLCFDNADWVISDSELANCSF